MCFQQLVRKIFQKVLNFPKILQSPLLFTPVSKSCSLHNTPASICLMFFFSGCYSIVAAKCMFFVISGHKLEAAAKVGCTYNDSILRIILHYRCLTGRMAMHACQIGPTDTSPSCPGSPLQACVGTYFAL